MLSFTLLLPLAGAGEPHAGEGRGTGKSTDLSEGGLAVAVVVTVGNVATNRGGGLVGEAGGSGSNTSEHDDRKSLLLEAGARYYVLRKGSFLF